VGGVPEKISALVSPMPGSILFLCGMNSIRSPMAHMIARAILPQNVYLESAGIRQGDRDPFVDAVLDEKGLTLGDRQPQLFEDLEDSYFDLIITFAPEAHHAALERIRHSSSEVEYWPMLDPTNVTGTREHIVGSYRDVRDRLEAKLRQRFSNGA
jgi:protein-tyrosine-phosphatase